MIQRMCRKYFIIRKCTPLEKTSRERELDADDEPDDEMNEKSVKVHRPKVISTPILQSQEKVDEHNSLGHAHTEVSVHTALQAVVSVRDTFGCRRSNTNDDVGPHIHEGHESRIQDRTQRSDRCSR